MLQRFSQVGEFYVLSKPVNVKPLQPGFMDILLFDEEADRHVKISYEDALRATGVVEINDRGVPEAKNDQGGNPLVAANTVMYTKADGTRVPFAGGGDSAWLSQAIKLAAANKTGAADASDLRNLNGVDAPVVIARPFIEHAMLSAVLAVSGGDTGATIFGPSDMQISANTSVKVIEGHYTGHFKAVVTKPQNVCVLKDIMSNGYRAGGNCKFFGTTPSDIRENLMSRLNFDDANYVTLPSMLAFPMTSEQFEGGSMDTVMSITTRLLPWEVTNQSHSSFPGGEEMQKFYDSKIGLRAVHFGEDLRASENMEYMAQGSTNNSLCFLGPHRKWDGLSKHYSQLVPGMGHWVRQRSSNPRLLRTPTLTPVESVPRS